MKFSPPLAQCQVPHFLINFSPFHCANLWSGTGIYVARYALIFHSLLLISNMDETEITMEQSASTRSSTPIVCYYDDFEYGLPVEIIQPKCQRYQEKQEQNKLMEKKNDSLRWVKMTEHASAPFRASLGSAGYDLSAAYNCVVPARGKAVVRTDIQIWVPDGTYGRIAPRSGLAANYHIDVGAGTIDSDYRGNVKIVLFNHSENDFHIERGDRVAQLICEKIVCPPLEKHRTLPVTRRGWGGFGWSNTEGYKKMFCTEDSVGTLSWHETKSDQSAHKVVKEFDYCSEHLREQLRRKCKKQDKVRIAKNGYDEEKRVDDF